MADEAKDTTCEEVDQIGQGKVCTWKNETED